MIQRADELMPGLLQTVRPWISNLLLCILGVGLTYLSGRFVSEHTHYTALGISGIAAWSVALYILAVIVALTQPTNRWSYGIILVFAFASRLQPILTEPFSSTDIYRYVWDGIVQHAHINPYRYVPADLALKFLRAPHQHIYDNINRKDYARTIYPPVAQMVYFLASWISPTVLTMKTVMAGFECVAVAAISLTLQRLGRPGAQVLLYAWCPLLVWEISGAGHIDAAVIGFVSLAILFRVRGSPVLTGLFLGLAVMTKFYPLVLFPALYRRGDWKMPATLATVVATGYAIYSSVGMQVFGFLGGYTEEEGMTTGSRYFLLQWAQSLRGLQSFSPNVYIAFCGLVFLAITIWAWIYATKEGAIPKMQSLAVVTKPNFLKAGAISAFALMLLFSPHYPWYIVWLVPFFALAPSLPLITYLMAFFYLFTTSLAIPGPGLFLLNKIMYGGILCAGLLQFAVQRWPVYRRFSFLRSSASIESPRVD